MNTTTTGSVRRRSVSVVVATRDRWQLLLPLLQQLAQAEGVGSVHVVDQSETRDRERCEEWFQTSAPENFHRMPMAAWGLPKARNAGWKAAEDDIVLYLDDDVTLEPGLIQRHLEAYDDETVGAVAGAILEEPDGYNAPTVVSRVLWYGRVWVRLHGGRDQDVESARGANMSFRRSVLHSVGGFDPGYGGTHYLEETDLCRRLTKQDWRVRYIAAASLIHHRAPGGGCRPRSEAHGRYWRHHNTGRYQRKHSNPLGFAGGLAYVMCAELLANGEDPRPVRVGKALRAYTRGWWYGQQRVF